MSGIDLYSPLPAEFLTSSKTEMKFTWLSLIMWFSHHLLMNCLTSLAIRDCCWWTDEKKRLIPVECKLQHSEQAQWHCSLHLESKNWIKQPITKPILLCMTHRNMTTCSWKSSSYLWIKRKFGDKKLQAKQTHSAYRNTFLCLFLRESQAFFTLYTFTGTLKKICINTL